MRSRHVVALAGAGQWQAVAGKVYCRQEQLRDRAPRFIQPVPGATAASPCPLRSSALATNQRPSSPRRTRAGSVRRVQPTRRAHRLLDRHEAAVHHADVRVRPHELGDGCFTPPQRPVSPSRTARRRRRVGARTNPRARVCGSGKDLGALVAHRDPHAVAVHVGDRAQRRSHGHEVRTLDDNVRRSESDLGRARRFDREECDVPRPRARSTEIPARLAGRRVLLVSTGSPK